MAPIPEPPHRRPQGEGDPGSPDTDLKTSGEDDRAGTREEEDAMRRTSEKATGDDRGNVSSILRVLADTPAAALEEELRRLEHEHLAGSDHLKADYLAVVRVRELAERRRRRDQEISILYSTARLTALRGGSTRRWRTSSAAPTTWSTPTSPT